MQKIPAMPKRSKTMAWLKRLPVPFQIILIAVLLYLTWHFRYYTDGVDKAELTKVEGTLYSFRCNSRISGPDDIILFTSFKEKEIWFRGWQKCKNLSEAIKYSDSPQQVVFYTKITKGSFSTNTDGVLRIYAVDLANPNKPLIHPVRGLGIHYNPNPFSLAFFFIALALIESLRERWIDYRASVSTESRKK
ncbi:hypothetical protein JAO78_010925 [Alishewanella sp. 16-MA]|uniref:Uncharacterized protein n=1 Tax=Alishewanella maricola TaxID=2795740 RepID=A0ABS8C4R3_9ALTE|nr:MULTISPECIES: hypothetical protein [Alishewanella]MCB5227326.1 hypothetical protein [Alishewanella maricola]MDP5035261.1 hypothetical protein [Alishewanella sp.]MDP5206673.1 hypothetical protein [Alishewanella sp. SMS9]MDP5460601.1 hypothetical protein [Alishewanella sp. SMS8]